MYSYFSTYSQIYGPHPRSRGQFAIFGFKTRITTEHDSMSFEEALKEVKFVRAERNVWHCPRNSKFKLTSSSKGNFKILYGEENDCLLRSKRQPHRED